MQEKLNNLKNNSLLEVSQWWGLREAGKGGIIITQDKYLYSYTFYYRLTPFLERNNIPLEYISDGKLLTNEEYKKVINFIEKEIVGKTFTSQPIFDASFNVSGNYNNHTFSIHNNVGFTNNEEGLYDKAKKLIETIKGEK